MTDLKSNTAVHRLGRSHCCRAAVTTYRAWDGYWHVCHRCNHTCRSVDLPDRD